MKLRYNYILRQLFVVKHLKVLVAFFRGMLQMDSSFCMIERIRQGATKQLFMII
jgi:hypothetical protein